MLPPSVSSQVGVCCQEGLSGHRHIPPELCHHQAERGSLHQHLGAGGEAVGCCGLRHPSAGWHLPTAIVSAVQLERHLPAGLLVERLKWCIQAFPVNEQEVGCRKAMLCLLFGLPSKYQSSPVSLAKVHDTLQAEVPWTSVRLLS